MKTLVIRLFLQMAIRFLTAVFSVSTLVFFSIYFLPGDPAARIAGIDTPAEVQAQIAENLQLDHPLVLQYLSWVGNVLRLDFGRSFFTGEAVMSLISQRIFVTMTLTVLSMLLAVGLSIGMASLCNPHGINLFLRILEVFFIAMPSFCLALLLLYLNVGGLFSVWSNSVLRSMIGPIIVLGLSFAAVLFRFLRTAIQREWSAPYVLFMRGMGVPARRIIAQHIFPNIFSGYVILAGVQTGYLLGGSTILERMFALPGMGNLLVSAVLDADYPVVLGVVVVISGIFTLINNLAEMLGTYLNVKYAVLESS